MAGIPVQGSRQYELITPLGPDVLLFRHMSAHEQLGRLFEIDLDVQSQRHDITPAEILGQRVSVRMDMDNHEPRYFDGFVSRFSHQECWPGHSTYSLTLRPWLWFLTRTANCRIFQEQSVPDIIEQIFGDRGFSDYELRLNGDHAPREYCVQYRETDFNFLNRLMEHEGIYYFFEHERGKHTLIMADHYGAHSPKNGYESVPFYPPDRHARRERDHIFRWTQNHEVQPGACVLRDFDFEAPSKNLETEHEDPRDHDSAQYEVFDYPGNYRESDVGDNYASLRMEELGAKHERARGEANARGLAAGSLFTFSDYPRDDQNCEYLLISTTIELWSNEYRSSNEPAEGAEFSCSFTAMDAQVPYRAPRLTPKPFVQGPQTAIVVGPSGEEIWTDEHGRVKVQFHWDREGRKDENSSCWIRVSHPWAGKNWGAVAIPRVDQEVIVDFLEGDPDQPIVTGRVYNGKQVPPYELPGQAMVSGVKTNSTPGGGGYNEISMDDTAGDEKVTIHAQHDMNTTVENDRTATVKQGNDSLQVKLGNREVSIDQGNHSLVIGMGNQTTEVSLGKSEHEAMQSIELKVGSSSIKIDQMGVTIKGMMIKIEGTTMVDVKGMMTSVKGDAMLKLKGGLTMIN